MSAPARRRVRAPVWVLLVIAALIGACVDPEADRRDEPPTSSDDAPPAPVERADDTGRVFVAPDGDDDAPGDEERPWATLEHALTQLQPGETLTVADGEYRERLREPPVRPGTEEEPIVVQAAEGARPTVRGLLWLRDIDHWRIRGLNVTWDEDRNRRDEHMVKLIGGTGWSFEGAEVWGARSFAAILVADEPDDWRLAELCVHDTLPTNDANQDQLLYINTGLDAGSGVVEDNVLFGAENGAGIKLGGPSEDSGGAANVEVVDNTIVDTQQGVMVSWRSRDNLIEGNRIFGAGRDYGLIRSYRLDNDSNVARDNVGGDAVTMFLDYRSPDGAVVDGGGNTFPVEPEMEPDPSCSGLRSMTTAAPSDGRS